MTVSFFFFVCLFYERQSRGQLQDYSVSVATRGYIHSESSICRHTDVRKGHGWRPLHKSQWFVTQKQVRLCLSLSHRNRCVYVFVIQKQVCQCLSVSHRNRYVCVCLYHTETGVSLSVSHRNRCVCLSMSHRNRCICVCLLFASAALLLFVSVV